MTIGGAARGAADGSGAATLVPERRARRDAFHAGLLAVLVFAIVVPLARDEPTDVMTDVALAFLALVAVVVAGRWVLAVRRPTSLVVSDDEIRLDPSGPRPELRRIERADGQLRLAKVGSVRTKTWTLSTMHGDGWIPLGFLDRDDALDACHAHGWDLGDGATR